MQCFRPSNSLSGGIGNQLFQWAAAHVLFKGAPFNLDLGHYQFNLEREFQLEPILKSCHHFAENAGVLRGTHLSRYFQWAAARGAPTSLLEFLGFFQETSGRKLPKLSPANPQLRNAFHPKPG